MRISVMIASVFLVFAGLAAAVWGSIHFTTISESYATSFAIGVGILYIAIAGVFLGKEFKEKEVSA